MAMQAEQAPAALPNPAFGNGEYRAAQLLTLPGENHKISASAAHHCNPLQTALGT